MSFWENNTNAIGTIAVGVACSVPCAILGCYLVLRRMSLLGDAISHAVLPGLVLAFLVTGSLSGWGMALGAGLLGVLTALLTQSIHKLADVPEDASMGVVYTSLFALGVILITRYAGGTDLDPGCVLYGLIEFTPLDSFILGGVTLPRALQSLGPTLLATVAFVALLWKELKIVSFDPALAAAMGLRVALIHYLLMAMVAGVTVASFEAVGSILVIAMLIVPAATGHLLSDRLNTMMAWAALTAVAGTVLGYFGAVWLNTSVAGMMAVALGGLFTCAVAFAPRHGVLAQTLRRLNLGLRIEREDWLGSLSRGLSTPRRGWRHRVAQWQLRRQGLVRNGHLTTLGEARGRELVRAHRLWETWLTTHLELPIDHVHDAAHHIEHFTGPALSDQLAEDLAHPNTDPHGQPIPPRHQ